MRYCILKTFFKVNKMVMFRIVNFGDNFETEAMSGFVICKLRPIIEVAIFKSAGLKSTSFCPWTDVQKTAQL